VPYKEAWNPWYNVKMRLWKESGVKPFARASHQTQSRIRRKETHSNEEEKSTTEKQRLFAQFVEELKKRGETGEEYRKKMMQWIREHKDQI